MSKTRRERLEARQARRKEWAEKRQAKSEQAREASNSVVLPPAGEPIKVGHHSERGHRRSLERANNLTRKSIDHADMARHHEEKAEGIGRALATSIYSDDADAIEKLEAKIAGIRAAAEKMKAANKATRASAEYKALSAEDKRTVGYNLPGRGLEGFKLYTYEMTNLNANARRLEKRLAGLRRKAERGVEQ